MALVRREFSRWTLAKAWWDGETFVHFTLGFAVTTLVVLFIVLVLFPQWPWLRLISAAAYPVLKVLKMWSER